MLKTPQFVSALPTFYPLSWHSLDKFHLLSFVFNSSVKQSICNLIKMAAPEIPKTHKAVVYDQPGTVSTKIVDLEVPEPGAGEVLINLYV
jgi:hypothetical protein